MRLRRPATLIVEQLDFTHPDFSKRLNRLVRRCGRKVFRKKHQDLEKRFGVGTIEVNTAYSAQQCSRCAYIASTARPVASRFWKIKGEMVTEV